MRREVGLRGEVEEGRDGGAEDVSVEDSRAEAQAGKGEGEVCCGGLVGGCVWKGVRGGGDVPATVLLPTPPLAEETAMTLDTALMLRFCGRPRWNRGIEPVLGRPWVAGVSLRCCEMSLRGELTRGFSWQKALDTWNRRTVVGFMMGFEWPYGALYCVVEHVLISLALISKSCRFAAH